MRASVRLLRLDKRVQCRTPVTVHAVQYLKVHTDSTVRTGYVFFGTLVYFGDHEKTAAVITHA